MEKPDLKYLCTVIGNLSGIPVRVYEDGRLSFYYCLVRLPKDPICVCTDGIDAIKDHIGYYATPQRQYYGVVNSGSTKIVIGPSSQIAPNDRELHELAFKADVSPDDTADFIAGMKAIVRMPLESILQILCTLNYVCSGEKKTREDIAIYDAEQESLQMQESIDRANARFEDTAQRAQHNTYDLEQLLLNMISKGDTAALREWVSSAPAVRGGIIAPEQLRQRKNTFIVTATLASRAAIRGGMAQDDAFSLSDEYIKKCELSSDPDRIMNLQYHMILQFTERVERLRLGKRPTKLTADVANFVQHHISEPVTAQRIADALFISRPYLSKKFREESGQTLTDFILKEKTEEAKRLLRYTDKPLSSISVYLGFSSQSHFTRVFRKYSGANPGEYREKHAGP
ncbi:MAG: helix-turn-helix domain-containing protein [Clostridia bacterium]|nr:helix-turn-helix domain-containing protein [Clostridia bacterium]